MKKSITNDNINYNFVDTSCHSLKQIVQNIYFFCGSAMLKETLTPSPTIIGTGLLGSIT